MAMSRADALAKRIGGNMASTLGIGQPFAGVDRSPARPTIPMADKNAGRTVDRGKGFMLLENIVPDPAQPRKEFDEERIRELADSIKTYGLLTPIVIRWDQELGKYKIVAGERRYRAMTLLQETSIPCHFSDDGKVPESELMLVQLTENIQREQLSPLEMARAFESLQKERGWNATKIAAALFVSKALVSQRMKLLELPEDLAEKVEAGTLSASAAYQVAKAGDADAQRALAARIETEGLTRDQLTEQLKQSTGKSDKPKPGRPVTKKDFALEKCKVSFTFRKKRVTQADLEEALDELTKLIRAA